MAQFPTAYKLGFLEDAWEGCPDATSLYEVLGAISRGHVQNTSGGYLVSSHSGAGTSTQFVQSNLNPVEFTALAQEVRKIYRSSKTYLNDTEDESLIYAEMCSRLDNPVRRFSSNFSTMGGFR